MSIMIYRIGFIFTTLCFLFACNRKNEVPDQNETHEGNQAGAIDWKLAADSSSKALAHHFWNSDQHYFNYSNAANTDFHYWPQAHALDVLLDAYNRTNDSFYESYINEWFEGVKAKNGGTFFNDYIDDMEWNALAMLRAYQITQDERYKTAAREVWEDIKTAWNAHAGGGLMWVKSDPYGKNACSNGPAAILAARLYQLDQKDEDLEWAKRIYAWEKNTLVDPVSGAVWDNINVKDGTPKINKDWVFTYNQGTFVGAAVALYKLTEEKTYLDDAIQSADYTLDSLTNRGEGILKSEGGGDGGLFKGIFIRYFTELIMLEDLPEDSRQAYVNFLEKNAETLWREGTHEQQLLFGPYWGEKPGQEVDLTVELSGAMLIEAAARLSEANAFQ